MNVKFFPAGTSPAQACRDAVAAESGLKSSPGFLQCRRSRTLGSLSRGPGCQDVPITDFDLTATLFRACARAVSGHENQATARRLAEDRKPATTAAAGSSSRRAGADTNSPPSSKMITPLHSRLQPWSQCSATMRATRWSSAWRGGQGGRCWHMLLLPCTVDRPLRAQVCPVGRVTASTPPRTGAFVVAGVSGLPPSSSNVRAPASRYWAWLHAMGARGLSSGGQRMPQGLAPHIGASIPARRSAVSTARSTSS